MLPDVVELATIEPGVRADLATQGGSTFTFDLRALIARTRPLEWPGASGAGVGWGGTSASPYCARRASDCAIFLLASACRASAFCIASRVARFFLLAAPHAPAPLESLMRLLLLGRGGIEHRTLRCCNFHSVLPVAPSTLRVSGAGGVGLISCVRIDGNLAEVVVLVRLHGLLGFEFLACLFDARSPLHAAAIS